jgi:hypothetical protein
VLFTGVSHTATSLALGLGRGLCDEMRLSPHATQVRIPAGSSGKRRGCAHHIPRQCSSIRPRYQPRPPLTLSAR